MNKKLDDEYYQLLEQIQAADFVLVELTHYLDTHPNDQQALQQFNQFHEYSKQLKSVFEPKYGPLLGLETVQAVKINGNGAKALGPGRYKERYLCGCMKRNCNIQLK